MTNTHKLLRLGTEVFKFLIVGLPAFIVAIPLNWFLVEKLAWWKPLAYAFVLVAQTTVNFFLCRRFVFLPSKEKSIGEQYREFMAAVAIFRGMDWACYSVVVRATDLNYILVQCMNVVIFSLCKFFFSKRAIEGKAKK